MSNRRSNIEAAGILVLENFFIGRFFGYFGRPRLYCPSFQRLFLKRSLFDLRLIDSNLRACRFDTRGFDRYRKRPLRSAFNGRLRTPELLISELLVPVSCSRSRLDWLLLRGTNVFMLFMQRLGDGFRRGKDWLILRKCGVQRRGRLTGQIGSNVRRRSLGRRGSRLRETLVLRDRLPGEQYRLVSRRRSGVLRSAFA